MVKKWAKLVKTGQKLVEISFKRSEYVKIDNEYTIYKNNTKIGQKMPKMNKNR
jgi:hypothetical protein